MSSYVHLLEYIRCSVSGTGVLDSRASVVDYIPQLILGNYRTLWEYVTRLEEIGLAEQVADPIGFPLDDFVIHGSEALSDEQLLAFLRDPAMILGTRDLLFEEIRTPQHVAREWRSSLCADEPTTRDCPVVVRGEAGSVEQPPEKSRLTEDSAVTLLESMHNQQQELSMTWIGVAHEHSGFPWYRDLSHSLRNVIAPQVSHPEILRNELLVDEYYGNCFEKLSPLRHRVISAVPTYLTRSRVKQGWSVIPYGWHTRLGVLVHPAHKVWSDFSGQKVVEAKFLSRLIAAACEHRARMYYIEGAIVHDLREDMICAAGLSPSIEMVDRCFVGVTPVSTEYRSVPSPKMLGELTPESVVLFDLGTRQNVSEWHERGYVDVVVRHGLQIQVGIGMSACVAAEMFYNDRWKHILANAVGVLKDHRHEFSECGIEIDEAFLLRVREDISAINQCETVCLGSDTKLVAIDI
jgi:hypothetical protein